MKPLLFAVLATLGIASAAAVAAIVAPLPRHTTSKQASSVVYIKIQAGAEKGHGSGVDIGNGYIVTAAHVADHQKDDNTGSDLLPSVDANTKTQISITDSLGKPHDVTVLWVNHAYDVALLKISDADKVSASRLNCHATYRLGEKLHFAGNPSFLHDVTTFGQVGNPNIVTAGPWKAAVTISGTLVPGMSGGPAFDSAGDVVGINVGVANVPGIGPFALSWIVPSSTVCMLMGRF